MVLLEVQLPDWVLRPFGLVADVVGGGGMVVFWGENAACGRRGRLNAFSDSL